MKKSILIIFTVLTSLSIQAQDSTDVTDICEEKFDLSIEHTQKLGSLSDDMIFEFCGGGLNRLCLNDRDNRPSSNTNMINLKTLAEFHTTHPNYVLEIGCHTDHRGAEKSNQKLSLMRAKSILHYLLEKHNVNPKNFIPVGYGESQQLISKNAIDLVSCNETKGKLLQINRRVTIKILEIK